MLVPIGLSLSEDGEIQPIDAASSSTGSHTEPMDIFPALLRIIGYCSGLGRDNSSFKSAQVSNITADAADGETRKNSLRLFNRNALSRLWICFSASSQSPT